MKTLVLLVIAFVSTFNAHAAPAVASNCPAVLNVQLKNLNDEPANLCDYAGQVVLVVNTASYCGFTSQYKDLEALYRNYQARGFTILGFPSNDFGQQEPGTNKEIAKFCKLTYGVEFPMFEKASIVSVKPSAMGRATCVKSTPAAGQERGVWPRVINPPAIMAITDGTGIIDSSMKAMRKSPSGPRCKSA